MIKNKLALGMISAGLLLVGIGIGVTIAKGGRQ